jgi:hypothetical protein
VQNINLKEINNKFILTGILTLLFTGINSSLVLAKPNLNNLIQNKATKAYSKSNYEESPTIPSNLSINTSKLSLKAKKAFTNIKQWSKNSNDKWIVIYREGKESYMIFSRNGEATIFPTNPEIGGAKYSLPLGQLFTINYHYLFNNILKKQNASGLYRFDSGYKEHWITPLVKIDIDGNIEDTEQFQQAYWATHSPPYTGNKVNTDLTQAGHSCVRLHPTVAKFIQDTVIYEYYKNQSQTMFYLIRYSPEIFEK